MNEKMKAFADKMFKVGTPECAITCGVAALVLAVLILLFGFWQTVLLLALMLLGMFIGGVKDKKGWLRNMVNRLFPPRTVQPYKADDVHINVEEKEQAAETEEEKAEESATEE